MSIISIFLLRKDTISPHTDDVITIRRQDNNILVKYTDNADKSLQNLVLTDTSLSTYIRNLGHLFLSDTEPFEKIQFNFPGFPCFMATQKSLKDTDTQEALAEIADIVSDSWFADYPGATHRAEDPYSSHY